MSTNLAYIQSKIDIGVAGSPERPMQGQSPYVINVGTTYNFEQAGLNLTLLYNRIGRRITEVGDSDSPDVYEKARNLLDFQISKKVLRNGAIRLNVSDLIHDDQLFYQNLDDDQQYSAEKDFMLRSFQNGYNASLSFNYTF